MTKEEFAQLLNGRQYRNEITKDEEKLAKENGLLICFGASDDLLGFRGIIYDDVDTYASDSAFLVEKRGNIGAIEEEELIKAKSVFREYGLGELKTIEIKVEWCPEDLDCSWQITTKIPNATFDIMEDGELYCRGIVIDKKDILEYLKS